jgi:hypothetical protein
LPDQERRRIKIDGKDFVYRTNSPGPASRRCPARRPLPHHRLRRTIPVGKIVSPWLRPHAAGSWPSRSGAGGRVQAAAVFDINFELHAGNDIEELTALNRDYVASVQIATSSLRRDSGAGFLYLIPTSDLVDRAAFSNNSRTGDQN